MSVLMRMDIWRHLARATVRLYPRVWRARYADEVDALLDLTRPGPRVVTDLAFGAIRERSSALGVLVWFVAVLVRAFALMMAAWATAAILFVLVVGPILSVRIGFDWSEWASRRIFDVPYAFTAGLPMYFFFSLQISLPILAVLLWPPVRGRHPMLARLIFTTAFCGFSIWLGHLNEQAAMLLCGWLIAVKVFPTIASAQLPATAPTQTSSAAGSEPPSIAGLRCTTVTP